MLQSNYIEECLKICYNREDIPLSRDTVDACLAGYNYAAQHALDILTEGLARLINRYNEMVRSCDNETACQVLAHGGIIVQEYIERIQQVSNAANKILVAINKANEL